MGNLPSNTRRYYVRKMQVMAGLSVIAIFGIGAPLSIIHELSHGMVCWSEGYRFDFGLTLMGGVGHCYGTPHNFTLFLALGGLMGGLVSGLPLVVFRKWMQMHRWMFISLLTLMVGHLTNAAWETFAYESYIQGMASIIVTQIAIALIWAGLLIHYIRIEKGNTHLHQGRFH